MSAIYTRSSEGLLHQLTTGLAYKGHTLYGSCIQQACCNVLEAQGLREADCRIGLSWGFTYRPGEAKLRSADRWVEAVSRLSGLDVRDERFGSSIAAFQKEQAALALGLPVVVTVDSFDIPSPHRERAHLMHALILLEWSEESVTVLDPMNAPSPAHMPRDLYEHTRGSAVAQGYRMITSHGRLTKLYSPAEALAALCDSAAEDWVRGLADLDAFTEAVIRGRVAPDVADVAAERGYAERVIAAAGSAEMTQLAERMDALSRRWYLAHTIGMEGGAPERLGRVLKDLRAREVELFADVMRAFDVFRRSMTLGNELSEKIARIIGAQTSVEADSLRPEDDLWAAGMTSLESVRVMIALEDELDIEFPAALLGRNSFSSVAAIESVIQDISSRSSETGLST